MRIGTAIIRVPLGTLVRALALLVLALTLAGCTASGATTGNFELTPARVGWYAGDEATFLLNLTPNLLRQQPSFTIDRRFAIEEVLFNERGARIGGDHATRDPDSIGLQLVRDGTAGEEWVMDKDRPSLEVRVRLPESLKDSEYGLELRVFEVGWVKSDPFRVDHK